MKQWTKKNKLSYTETDDANLGDFLSYGSFLFILVNSKQNHWNLVDTIIHESVHVFQKLMSYVGETSIGIETEAYYIAEIATNLLKDYEATRLQGELSSRT